VAQPRADTPSKIILSGSDLHRVVDRIAHQILEKTSGATGTVLLGIPTRGVPLARRLAARIHAFEGIDVPVGALDITLYRDDLRLHATRALGKTELPGDGIALDALSDEGRPSSVQLAVLVDRGHRQLPIRADYVGKNIPTALSESVRVLLTETDGLDEIKLTGSEK